MTLLVQDYFSQSAQRYPDKIAVCCESEQISYRALDEFSNAFARQLQSKGIARGQFVPFFMKKGINSIKSILATLKADCAYIPIDINSPEQRLRAILASAKAGLVIVDDHSQPILEALLSEKSTAEPSLPGELLSEASSSASQYQLLNVDRFSAGDHSPLTYSNLSIDLAYVLFTSGSTGVPKGVMIPHKAITDYIDWCVDVYAIGPDDVVANHAPLYFDNSTFDLYTAFKSGATLHLVHDELNAVIPRLVKWLNERDISVFFCVPSVLTMLLRSRRLKPDSLPALKHLICAGEVLPSAVLSEWMALYPHIQFTNMYGPTEITVDCSYHMISGVGAPGNSVPIGKPRRNMELFVKTEGGSLSTSIGAQGELLVRGTSVAYGYLGDTAKTEKAFIQNPLNNNFHDPLYCTGDLVRIDDNNDFLFLGRADDQIKYLGYRIELGEVESALNNAAGVDEGVVVFNNSEDEQQRAIGALVKVSANTTVEQLRAALQNLLPPYMVPTTIKLLEGDFPRTPNGKYDRKAVLNQLFA